MISYKDFKENREERKLIKELLSPDNRSFW